MRTYRSNLMGLPDHPVQFSRRAIGGVLRRVRGVLRRVRSALRAAYHAYAKTNLSGSFNALRVELSGLQEELRKVRSEVAGQVSFLSYDVIERLGAFDQRLIDLQSSAFEAKNKLIHLDTSLHTRFNDVLNVQFPTVLEQVHHVSAFQLRMAGQRRSKLAQSLAVSVPGVVGETSFGAVLARAERDFPTVFRAWKERLDEMEKALAETEVGNVANSADIYSYLFRTFVEHYAEGAVLDVGCGPAGMPFYLTSYPAHLVAGIDPLLRTDTLDIKAVRGISEYLPWPDESFSTVISATSLDHCIALDRSMDEMVRVLRPDGKLLIWLGSNPGSPPYKPLDPDFVPADRFHLFHFDIEWFEPMLGHRFRMLDRVKLDRAGYSHLFYCLTPSAS